MAEKKFGINKGLNLQPQASLTNANKGDLEVSTSTGKLHYHDGSSDSVLITDDSVDTLTNKTIDADGTGNVISNIDNGNIKAGAAIEVAKLAALTVSRAVVTDGSGVLAPATTTATEIGYVNGVTSAIQGQIDAKQATGNYVTGLTGDVTATGPGSVAATIATNAVTNSKAAQMPTLTIKGNNTGGTANALDLTVSEVNTMLGSLSNPMDSIGDIIYGGASGVATKLDAGNAGELLQSNGAAAPSWIKANAYVGTNPEVGGASPFQMVVANAKSQTINPAGAITLRLPTTSVLAGEIYTISNRSANLVTIQSSGANDIYALNLGNIKLVALQAAPTTAAHWEILDVNDTITGTIGSTGSFTSGGIYKMCRSGKVVTLVISTAQPHSSSASPATAAGFIPSKFTPTYTAVTMATFSSTITQLIGVDTSGSLSFSYKDWAGANSAQITSLPNSVISWVVG